MSRRLQRPASLRHGHRHELVPARHAAQLPALVVPLREGLELMSRHQLEKLRENHAIMGHGLNIPVFDWYSTNPILQQGAFRPLLFPHFVGQQ